MIDNVAQGSKPKTYDQLIEQRPNVDPTMIDEYDKATNHYLFHKLNTMYAKKVLHSPPASLERKAEAQKVYKEHKIHKSHAKKGAFDLVTLSQIPSTK